MIAALSSVSSQACWILCSENADQILSHVEWNDSDGNSLSSQMALNFSKLLDTANIKKDALTKIYCVTGPGSFTGLRTSAAFCLGLGRALNIPTFGLSTFEVIGQPFAIPLQHQKMRKLSLSQATEQKSDFLVVASETDCKVTNDVSGKQVFGLEDKPFWPTTLQLQNAVIHALKTNKSPGVKINYGFDPKYF